MDTPVSHQPAPDLEQGFSAVDPWPEHAARTAWRSRPRIGRGIVIVAVAVGVGVAALTLIQVFAVWFGPCLHGAC
jgi:hypothetical protein